MRMQRLALVTVVGLIGLVVGCTKQGATPEPQTAGPGPAPGTMGGPVPGTMGGPTPGMMGRPATGIVAPMVPAEIAIPEGHKPTFMAVAKGVQIYDCAAEAGGAPAWKLHAPRADLVDDAGGKLASHFGGVDRNLPPGPYWEASDGSRVHGAKPASVPNPGSIPLLRLEAADTSGTGVFSKVTFVQRLDTTGGVAPAGACTPGKQTEVPYTAKYYFYTAR